MSDGETTGNKVVRVDPMTHKGSIPLKSGETSTIVVKRESFVFSQ
jgi:hypothetical protein